ncbi:hypothetical protein J9317_08250 [Metabacillus sp. KIGAM252]|uniref:DUF3149 domain-containing protein n=1 Tax=Metabacillus flavus TaxID=2823519 RepID=A0ABS5LDC2_9BACI|nr:hypothetical protein [Metabacillus flavus]MBS2968746.1 hypothetical protein [Metabacillus flavus]
MGSGNLLFMILVAGLALVLAAIFVMMGVVIVKSVKNAKNKAEVEKTNENDDRL